MRPSIAGLLLVSLIATTACRHRDEESKVPVHMSRPIDTSTARPLGAGDVRITSTDDGVDLAMIGDTISGGLSSLALAKVRRETDTNAVAGTGFGASIEKMVKGSVQSALRTRISVPLGSVKDVHYDGQRLVFEWNGKAPTNFGDAKVNNKDVMASFSPGDAQRFVDAVRARKAANGRQM
ncbi:hypothetical protein BH09GEM1_BH09GEM1_02930 [soil metagenome]